MLKALSNTNRFWLNVQSVEPWFLKSTSIAKENKPFTVRITQMKTIESLYSEIDSNGWLSPSSNASREFSPNFNDRPDNTEPTLIVLPY